MNLLPNPHGTHLWCRGRIIQDLFACPIQQDNRRYTVALFDAGGRAWMISQAEYETIESAMSASLDQAIQMKMALTELKLAYQLQASGLLGPQEVDKIERAIWQW